MDSIVVRSDTGLRTVTSLREHTIVTDEPVEKDGMNSAPSPMELFVTSLGACMSVTARMYAQRKQWPLENVTVEVSYERFNREDYPAYTGDSNFVNEIHMKIVLEGPLSKEQRARLLEIAQRCPVHRALESPTFFIDESENALVEGA